MIYSIGIKLSTLSWEHYGCDPLLYDINNVITKLYMRRHVSGGVLCNEYCIRSDHEGNQPHFIMSFTVEIDFFSFDDLGNLILILS